MTNLNMIFYVVVQVYQFVKIWNLPQLPAEFQNGQWVPRQVLFNHCQGVV